MKEKLSLNRQGKEYYENLLEKFSKDGSHYQKFMMVSEEREIKFKSPREKLTAALVADIGEQESENVAYYRKVAQIILTVTEPFHDDRFDDVIRLFSIKAPSEQAVFQAIRMYGRYNNWLEEFNG